MRKKILLSIALSLIFLFGNYANVGARDLPERPKLPEQHNREQSLKPIIKNGSKPYLPEKFLIATKKSLIIPSKKVRKSLRYMMSPDFSQAENLPTMNPVLGESAPISSEVKLYQITENTYQVRGFDTANITFIKGETGYIVIDPLIVEENARVALDFVYEQLGERPVTAVIFTHNHINPYGEAYGVLNNDNPIIYAPSGFIGTGKSRIPDVIIAEATKNLFVDGVEMIFQLTNDTEFAHEMNIYLPAEQALCIAENCTATSRNLYTLHESEVRDPEHWAHYLDETISLFGNETQTIFSTHNRPRFGNNEVVGYIKTQRDCYRYINDQTLVLINEGYSIDEIGRRITFSDSLAEDFFNGEFYGTVFHNARAVYQRHLGWSDSTPVNLDKFLPTDSAKKYVQYMGGAERVLRNAHEDFSKGEYQWVAEVSKQVFFADPSNDEARLLWADALEQLGLMSESTPWGNEYLVAAHKLRNALRLPTQREIMTDVWDTLSIQQLVSMIGLRINADKAVGENIIFNIIITDDKLRAAVHLKNGSLVYLGRSSPNAKFTVKMTRNALYVLATGSKETLPYEIDNETDKSTFESILSMLNAGTKNFHILES